MSSRRRSTETRAARRASPGSSAGDGRIPSVRGTTVSALTGETVLGAARGPAWMRALAWLVARFPSRLLGVFGAVLGVFGAKVVRIRRAHAVEAALASGIAEAERVVTRMYVSLATSLFEL